MATTTDYIEYVCEQIPKKFNTRYRKMFGEYMVYINDKPILLVCDNTVYVKMLKEIESLMVDSSKGIPYAGSKEHYILSMEDEDQVGDVLSILETITPLPKKK